MYVKVFWMAVPVIINVNLPFSESELDDGLRSTWIVYIGSKINYSLMIVGECLMKKVLVKRYPV